MMSCSSIPAHVNVNSGPLAQVGSMHGGTYGMLQQQQHLPTSGALAAAGASRSGPLTFMPSEPHQGAGAQGAQGQGMGDRQKTWGATGAEVEEEDAWHDIQVRPMQPCTCHTTLCPFGMHSGPTPWHHSQ